MDAKTPLGLVMYCYRARAEKVLYWYACQYQERTANRLASKARDHPDWYQGTPPSIYASYGTNYNWCVTTIDPSQRACDCVGLPLGYMWHDFSSPNLDWHYQYGGAGDWSADEEWERATVKGTMDTLPKHLIGIGLHEPGHCGVYIGGGKVIQSSLGTDILTGERNIRGVFMSDISANRWDGWFQFKFFTYPTDSDWIVKNAYLTETEMQSNAYMVATFFLAEGWTLNAVAGMLGNMEAESTINPGIWQGLVNPFPADPSRIGFGLTQWTPYTKFTNWAGSEYLSGNKQCERIAWEFNNHEQYYPTAAYPETAKQFTQSDKSPEYLAAAFVYNYERPETPNPTYRGQLARKWYNYLNKYPAAPQPGSNKLPLWMLFKFNGRGI